MNKKTLRQLYAEHQGKVSDKWSSYLLEYGRIFSEFRDRPIRLMEIGVQNGGSLELWARFFPNAEKLVGCDINPDCARLVYEDSRVVVVVGDANSATVESAVLLHSPKFDVIIDDGSHRSGDIVKSFIKYFQYLSEGGVFVAEDLHCSYWREFEGGLFDPFSSITFFKRLADIVNHEHWGVTRLRADILRGFFSRFDVQIDEDVLAQIHSVEFVNSMCVVRKEAAESNSLGSRFFAGSDESIVSREVAQYSGVSVASSQENNPCTLRLVPPDEDVLRLENEIVKRDVVIEMLRKSRDEMLNSTSWQVTGPLRYLKSKIVSMLNRFR